MTLIVGLPLPYIDHCQIISHSLRFNGGVSRIIEVVAHVRFSAFNVIRIKPNNVRWLPRMA